jgi:hypothetical protein
MVHYFTRLDLRKVLPEMAPTTFSVTIEITIRIEGENIEHVKTKGKVGQRFFTQKRFRQSQCQKNKIPRQEKFVVPRNPIVYYRCGKENHRAVDYFQIKAALQHVKCYQCGKKRHKANHCNKLQRQSQCQKKELRISQ